MRNFIGLLCGTLLTVGLCAALAPSSGAAAPNGTSSTAPTQFPPLRAMYQFNVGTLNVGVSMIPIGGTGTLVGRVSLQGFPVPQESLIATPTGPGTWEWVNLNGNTGTIQQFPNGDAESVVTSGPNTGTTRYWNRL